MNSSLAKILKNKSPSFAERKECFEALISASFDPEESKKFLLHLNTQGVLSEDIRALLQVLRIHEIPFISGAEGLDICGTGGDGAGTFNISTCAALIAAGAGIPIIKHGNRAASSQCGSADVLEALGIKVDFSPDIAQKCFQETNFVFLFAPLYHPILKQVAKLRKELGVKTIFNLLGPLANPAHTSKGLVGVSSKKDLALLSQVLFEEKVRHYWVVYNEQGLDEFSLTGKNWIHEVSPKGIEEKTFEASDLKLNPCRVEDLLGGDALKNAQLIESILRGKEKGARRDVALLNAAAVLRIHSNFSLQESYARGEHSVNSGKAYEVLQKLRDFSLAH